MVLAYLDWASGPQSARNPTSDPNAFFGSHQFLSAIVAEAFLLAVAYLLIDVLVDLSLNRRWAEAVKRPLGAYVRDSAQVARLASKYFRDLEDACGTSEGWLTVGDQTREELQKRTAFTIEHLDEAIEKIQRSYRFLVPVLAASPQLIPILEAVEAQDRRLGRLQSFIRLSLQAEDAFTTNGFEDEKRHLKSYEATLSLLDQPLEVLTADLRLGDSLGKPMSLGQIT